MREAAIVEAEIRHLETQWARLERGELDPELFKRLRLQYGVYSLRASATSHMIRVRLGLGIVTPQQLDALADVCERWTPSRSCHLTTRQDVQLYGVDRRYVPALLRALAAAGLTTREASGNVVRNITCCPWAGVSPTEPFDITPYAAAVSEYLLRNPLAQLLPRKVKIAFEGCAIDHARTAIHDLGVVAAQDGGRPGVRVYVGGGLGPAPRVGQLLEPWTGMEQLLPTIEAVLRVFDRAGERRLRAKARLKFLVSAMGWDAFRAQVLQERERVWATQSGRALALCDVAPAEGPPAPEPQPSAPPATPRAFLRWRATNAATQQQTGYSSVLVRVPLGDVTVEQLRGVARLARRFGLELRSTNTQNLLLRWVPAAALPSVHEALLAIGLAQPGAGRLIDVTRCPGADSCLSAITHPRGLAQAVEALCVDGLSPMADAPLSVKISGCPNSCGHHLIADIGCFGMAVKVGGRPLPYYQLLVGGSTAEGRAAFGRRLIKLPACRVPDALKRLLVQYDIWKQPEEAFAAFVERVGLDPLAATLADLADVSSAAADESLCRDLGTDEPFQLDAGKGECAA